MKKLKSNRKNIRYILLFLICFLLINKEEKEPVLPGRYMQGFLEETVMQTGFFTFTKCLSGEKTYGPEQFLLSQSSTLHEAVLKEQVKPETEKTEVEKSRVKRIEGDIEQYLIQENTPEIISEKAKEEPMQEALESVSGNLANASPEAAKQREYDWSLFADTESVVKEFYTIDKMTEIKENQLNIQEFLQKDMRLKENVEGPQILIYHTHSVEGFADSVPGDDNTTIVGAGRKLKAILEEKYGLKVMHHEGRYDVESRDSAYANSLPEIKKILEENPQIEVVIDLHRDAMPEETRLVTEIEGKQTARFMFFNGLSYLKEKGDIEYLANPYIGDNLAFSFRMQALCNEYYPGLARKIYLKGYRYNMHLCPKSLLVEMGAQNNTVEEIHNSVERLAHVLYLCLTEENPY